MTESIKNQSTGVEGDGTELPFRSHVGPLIFLTGIFFLNFLTRVVIAPLMPTIEEDLGISHAEAGFFIFTISFGYFAGLLGSGFVSSRLTHRWTIVFSSVAVGGALMVVAFSQTLWMIHLGLAFGGIVGGFYLPSGMAVITSLVSASDWGKAIAIHEMAPNLGFIAAPLLAELLLEWRSWRGVLALTGISSALSGIAFMRFGRGGVFPGEAPGYRTIRILLREPSFWIMVFLFSMGIGASMGIYTMIPLYLVTERGMGRHLSNTLVGLSRISGLVMAFVAGWVTDRLGPKRVLISVFISTGAMTIVLGLAPGLWISIPIFLQPLLAASFFPAGFAALSKIGPSSVRNVTVSLTVPVAFLLGGGAIPALIGIMGEISSFAMGIAIVGGVFMMGSYLVRYLHFSDEQFSSAGRS